MRPGQVVRFLYTLGEPGVHAWDLPNRPNPKSIDVQRYTELLLRAAGSALQPFGVDEDALRALLLARAYYLSPGLLPVERKPALPLLSSRLLPVRAS